MTDSEETDMERFSSLGVIIGKQIPDRESIEKLFTALDGAFEKDHTTKEEIVGIIKDYLPNFEHMETGKSLDGKM